MEFKFRTEYQFSTDFPFTRGSFTASVRDHNDLRDSEEEEAREEEEEVIFFLNIRMSRTTMSRVPRYPGV